MSNQNPNNPDDSFLHVNSINRCVRARTKKSMFIYEDMLKKCFRRIKLAVDLGEKSCFYTTPEFILGKPSYKMNECLKYLYDNIIRYGYYVKFLPPNVLFVSWIQAFNDNYTPITNEHIVKTSYQQYLENTQRTEVQERLLPQAPAAPTATYRPLPNTSNLQLPTSQPNPLSMDTRLPIPPRAQPPRQIAPPPSHPAAPPQPIGQPRITLSNEQSPPQAQPNHATPSNEPSIFNIVPRSSGSNQAWKNEQNQTSSKPEYKPLKFNNDLKGIFK